MPRTNKPQIDTLPEPELNPVLNPLLAAHMGRWAEVYFTTLPENREQAVAELLRELQSGSFPESAFSQAIDDETTEKEVARNAAPDAPPQVSDAAPISAAHWNESETFVGAGFPEYAIGGSSLNTAHEGQDDREVAWTLQARNLPHFDVRSDRVSEVERKPVPYRYRIYVSVTLAILLTFLLYMAWRGAKATSHAAVTPSSLPITTPEAKAPDPAVRATNTIKATSPKRRPAATRAASRATMAKSRPLIGAEPGGVDEFVTAERYLKGALGTTPDSREAARWFWKAVGDGNLAATMALADLYLRGEGVPKSCDEAHLLLDAAARKGAPAAAERLRHLEAFGCQ